MASRITTVTLVSGTEQEISFDAKYSYFFIRNDSNSTAYVSLTSGISAGADGVISIPVGDSVCTTHGYPADKLYLLGDGSVHICGREHEINPFKTGSKGGGSGAVDVGNVNLFKNSGFNGTTGWATYGAPTVAVNDGVISVTVTDAGLQWIYPSDISMFKHGATYTIQAWLKADMPIKMCIGVVWGKKVVDVTTEWALYTYTYTTSTTDGDNYIRPVLGTNAPYNNTTYYVKQPKLVEGNKITTSWEPSPYDIPQCIQAGKITTDNTGKATVTFPRAFSSAPAVYATSHYSNTGTVFGVQVLSVSATGCVLYNSTWGSSYSSTGRPVAPIQWLAIGT